LAGAQSAYAAAQIGHLAAQGARQRSAAWLAERGVALSDAALDEFGRYVAEDSDAPIERALAAIAASSSSEQPEVERVSAERSAASADALMAFLRLVDPVTLFTAIQPFGAWPDMRASGANQAPAVTRGAEWDVAVRTGLNLGAIGEMAQEATLIGERQGELEAIRRVWRESLATRRARLETSASSWRSSLEWRAAARHALEEVDRRYRAGEADVSIDARFEAQNDAFDAERSELEARGVLLELLAESQLALVEGAIQ
jgi:hypothetical protein